MAMHTRSGRLRGTFLLPRALTACVALHGVLTGGCNIVGPVMYLAAGPDKTDARFRLDSSRAHVILVDDLRSRLPRRSLGNDIARAAEETLLREGVLKPDRLIESRSLQRSLSDETAGRPTPAADIGREAGASVVIHVSMQSWGLTRDGTSASPSVEMSVKVLDCENRVRLWPPGDQGYLLTVAPKSMQGELPLDLASRRRLEDDLARRAGVALAQLFFKHETSTSALK